MAHSTAEHERVQALKLPPTPSLRRQLQDYLDRAGMTPEDLAHEINRSATGVQHFLRGTYNAVASTDVFMRADLYEYMEGHPVFGADDDIPSSLLPTTDTKTLLGNAEEARRHRWQVLIEGPPGTSKTVALQWYAATRRHKDAIYLRAFTDLQGFQLLGLLCRKLGANTRGRRDNLFRNVVRKLRQMEHPVLLIDEAQHLLDTGLKPMETLRDVYDAGRCGLVLAGHFSLLQQLSNGIGSRLEQCLSRFDLKRQLHGLSEEELEQAAAYYLPGEKAPAELLKALKQFALVADRNAVMRYRAFLGRSKKKDEIPLAYYSFRRVAKFFARLKQVRELEANRGKSLGELARAVPQLLLSAEWRPI